MARVPNIKKIQKEDFEKDDQDLIEKLAYPMNSFMEQVKSALDKNLDYNNINRELIVKTDTVDTNGRPTIETKFRSSLRTRVAGVQCINALNLTAPAIYPVSQPFLSTTQSGTLVTVNNITGLQANNKYQLTLISEGTQS